MRVAVMRMRFCCLCAVPAMPAVVPGAWLSVVAMAGMTLFLGLMPVVGLGVLDWNGGVVRFVAPVGGVGGVAAVPWARLPTVAVPLFGSLFGLFYGSGLAVFLDS